MKKTETTGTETAGTEAGAGVTLETAKANLDALTLEHDRLPAAIQAAANTFQPQEITRLRRRLAEVKEELPDAKIVVSMLQEKEYQRMAEELTAETERLYPIAAAADDAFDRAQKAKEKAFGDWQDASYRAREYQTYIAQERQNRQNLQREQQKAGVDRALNAPISQSWG